VIPKVNVSKDEALDILAEAIAVHEGFYLSGSIAYDYNNPGAIRRWGSYPVGYRGGGFVIFPTIKEGWAALYTLLRNRCQYNQTLYDLIAVYAPKSDGNNPLNYASILAKKLGVSINTRISDIYCK